MDREIRVLFPAYPHCVWAFWWQGGKRLLWTSRCLCRGRLSTLKTPCCPWHWVPGSRLEFWNGNNVPSLYSLNIAVVLNRNQTTNFSETAEQSAKKTWQEVRSQRLLLSLCFSWWLENQDGHPGRCINKDGTFYWDPWYVSLFGPCYKLTLRLKCQKLLCIWWWVYLPRYLPQTDASSGGHLHNVKVLRLAPRHKPLTTLADIFRVSAKNNLI